jgi:hypothetical protein
LVVKSECIKVHEATIDIQLVVNDGCLMPIPAAKIIAGVLLDSSAGAMSCTEQQ